MYIQLLVHREAIKKLMFVLIDLDDEVHNTDLVFVVLLL